MSKSATSKAGPYYTVNSRKTSCCLDLIPVNTLNGVVFRKLPEMSSFCRRPDNQPHDLFFRGGCFLAKSIASRLEVRPAIWRVSGKCHCRPRPNKPNRASAPARPLPKIGGHPHFPCGYTVAEMSQTPFVHLHCHTDYSLLDGACEISS